MRVSNEEKARKYYNRKLLQGSMKEELKKPHKINWKALFCDILGIILGMTCINLIDIENHIDSAAGSIIVEVLLIAAAIIVVHVVVSAVVKCVKGRHA